MPRIPRLKLIDLHLVTILVVPLVSLLPFFHAHASSLSAQEKRGEIIYNTGVSPSGDSITAYLVESNLKLPGEAATCGGCHGRDGTGRPESGVIPTNITWRYLTKSYGHIHPNGLQHPPFTENSLKEYLRTGIYPGDRADKPSISPYHIYDISDRDLDDLIAYIKRLGENLDPGLSDTGVILGTIIPFEGPLAEAGQAAREILEAYFNEVNRNGGIYGRKIKLVVHGFAPVQQSKFQGVKDWLKETRPLALVGTFTPDMDLEVQSYVSSEDIPLIGPLTLHPLNTFSQNRNVFYVFSGLAEQVLALIRFGGQRLEITNPRIAILYPENRSLEDVIAAAEGACKNQDWQVVRKRPLSSGLFQADELVRELQEVSTDVVISLTLESQLRSLLDECADRNWSPYVLASGVLSGRIAFDAPPAFEKKLYLAYPTLPRDRKAWAVSELLGLIKTDKLRPQHAQAIISAYSAAKILVEAMRLSGRDLDRKELAEILEKFYQFDTGLTPPITYTRNRRIGAKGAYILRYGPEMDAKGGLFGFAEWVELN